MAPILGIYASSASPNIYSTAFNSIATTTVGAGGASSITFTSIPSTYTHLQVRYTARGTIADVNTDVYCWINGDTTQSKYARHYIRGNGTAASAGVSSASTVAIAGTATGGNSSASMFGVGIIDILDYTNTNKYKTTRSLSGEDQNGSGNIWFFSNLFMDTSAVSSLTIVPQSNGFAQYSSFALYGIRG